MKKGVLPSTLDAALQIGCQRALTVAKRSWKKEVSFSLDNNFNKDIIQNANNLQIQIVCIFAYEFAKERLGLGCYTF